MTIEAVARMAGAPTGSIYHRFASREDLLAETWVSTMAAFQPGFLAALREASDPAGLAAVLFPVQWARSNLDAARLLVLYRRQDFVGDDLPEHLRTVGGQMAAELGAAISEFAISAFGNREMAAKQRAAFLVLDLPNAAMRRYLAAGIRPPQDVDQLLVEAVTAMSTAPAPSD
jgi:AcrR family transcriptional regulator